MNNLEIPPLGRPSITDLILSLSSRSLRVTYEDSRVHPPRVTEWLREEGWWGKYVYIGCTIYSALRIGSVFYLKSLPLDKREQTELVIRAGDSLLHALIIIMGAIFVYLDKSPPSLQAEGLSGESKPQVEKALERASEAIRQFLTYWRLLWLFWFFLYLTLAIFYFFYYSHAPQLWFFNTVSNTFNNFTALFLYAMYHELTERTVEEESKRGLWQILLIGAFDSRGSGTCFQFSLPR